ncbi:MAG TPA: methylmalonyl-CoA epimerase [Longimicrobiales bacterium]|nr:methylmalonyl-CoA epimerase [Longimicrobiales bacterium]
MTSSSDVERRLDHIGVAVHSLAESSVIFELISGEPCSPPETVTAQGVRVAFVGAVELLEPTSPDTTIGRFLSRRGQALHHIAYRTDDLEGDLARLEAAGVELIDRAPRQGAGGHRVAFVHPSSTGGILIELVERSA